MSNVTTTAPTATTKTVKPSKTTTKPTNDKKQGTKKEGKNTTKPTKTATPPVKVDGRKHAKPFDIARLVTAGTLKVKTNKVTAKLVTSTPIQQQDGKGTRGLRESYNGISKCAIVRFLGARGIDQQTAFMVLAKLGIAGMTKGVMSKQWGYGSTTPADYKDSITGEDAKTILGMAK